MLTPPFTTLMNYLAVRYASLGPPLKLAPLTFEFRISNNLFEYSTTGGRFLLKVMAHPQALYGQQNVAERLEVIGQAVFDLHCAGLPVEEIVRGDDDRFVHQYQGHIIRLYVFNSGRTYADTDPDARDCARSLRRLHTEGLSCLSDTTRRAMTGFEKAYPMSMTANELPMLYRFLKDQAGLRRVYAQILEQWETVEWAVKRTLSHRPLTPEIECLVHTDFHPRNALFANDQATMIDLDNMIIDRRLPCLAFSILRFAFLQRERTPEVLQQAIAVFAMEEQRKSGFLEDLHHAMIFVEIEKVLRILHRMRTTGQYAAFIDNICPLHLANIKFLSASVVCA
jgi:Ser/Thr protein kinase RdoA (MazF antagonist)